MFEFKGILTEWNTRGDRPVNKTPITIRAKNIEEAHNKARGAVGAKYDDFRKFWSHSFEVESITEVPENG